MQATMEKISLKLVKGKENLESCEEIVNSLLKIVENADQQTKNEIENKIVSLGEKAVPFLINAVKSSRGIARGIAAMSLIRIGLACVVPLKKASAENKEFLWIADYLIREIEGSKTSINSKKQAMVC